MKRIVLLFISLFFCCFSFYAQNILKGSVSDESQMAIPAATIRVLSVDSVFVKGEITDESGLFQIREIKAGSYILAVSCIGYEDYFLPVEVANITIELPPIILKTDNIMLDNVTVTANSFIQKKDHLLVIPGKQQVKHAFTGYDLLYNLMIPGLKIDRKDKAVSSLTGDVTLYINGVKADAKEIQSLQPKDVEKVEYYVLPTSGPFTGDAASVNYITKVYKRGGYITLDGEQNIGYLKGDYNIGAKMTSKNTSYSFWGGHNMKSYNGVETKKSDDLLFADYIIDRTMQTEGAAYKNNQQYAQFKINNDTKKRNLSAMFFVVRDETPHDIQNEILDYTDDKEYSVQASDDSYDKSLRSSVNLNGLFNINEFHQLKLRLNGGYTQNTYKRRYTEGEDKSYSNADEDLYSFDGQLAYLFQPNASNTLYSRVTHFHNVTTSLYGGDYSSRQHLWKGETLFQFDYTHSFSKKLIMMLSPGASWLNYKLHGNDLVSSWNIRINSWIRYIPSAKQWVGVGFSLGNNQPDISYVNTANQTIDLFQIKRGNPFLDNTTMYQCFAMYMGQLHPLFNVQCKLWYSKDVHNVTSIYYWENDKLINSYSSDTGFNTANVDLAISSRFSDKVQTNINLKYGYMYVPEVSFLHQHNFVASFDINYFIKSFAVNAYVKTTEKELNRTSLIFLKSPASYGLSVRYSRKNWMAEVGTENPFTKHCYYRSHADYGVYKFSQVQASRIYQQTGYVKLAYTFDFGRKTSLEKNSMDKTIKSAIMKVK